MGPPPKSDGSGGFKFPEPPVLFSGAFGGPVIKYLVTPIRNSMTFAAQDASLSLGMVGKNVFARGFFGAWKGGHYPAIAACPQFLCLGPAYHTFNSVAGPWGALVLTAITETTVLYGAETKNAQLATNAKSPGKILKMQSPFNPYGPGVGINLCRNIFAMSGMRILPEPVSGIISKLSGGRKGPLVTFVSDIASNCCAASITMPMHMLYQYVATAGPELWDKPQSEQVSVMKTWLRDQYFPGGKLSPTILRDLCLRCSYIASVFTMYMQLERAAIKYWPF
jgi:hypothetical protein